MEKLSKINLAKKIEEKIKNKQIKIKPKWHFILKSVLLLSFVFIFLLASVYILNFIIFIFHEHKNIIDTFNLSHFDFKKFMDFVKIIPGILVFLLFVFIFSLYRLIKKYSFVYRRKGFYFLGGIFILILIIVLNIHFFLDRDFRFARFGERGEAPALMKMHQYYRPEFYINQNNKAQNNFDSTFPVSGPDRTPRFGR